MSTARLTLDNPVFVGRFRDFGRGSHFSKPVSRPLPPTGMISELRTAPTAVNRPVTALPVQPRQSRSQVLQRTITKKPTYTPVKSTKKLTSQKLLVAMAGVVFVAGLVVAGLGMRTNKQVVAQVKSATTQADAAQPDESKPSQQAMGSYRVDPASPRYVRIAKLGVFSRVTRQGVDSKGALKAPANVHDVGWYENSSKPGQAGAMLLDSHVAGPTTKGAFNRIKELVSGDRVEVERGDGQKFTYKVVKSVVSDADKTDMSSALVSVEQGKPGLNLITCTGAFDSRTNSYKQRLIVYAVQE